MKVTLKISGPVLDRVRADLARPHAFAHERVGFLLAAAAEASGGLLLLTNSYVPVADEDYERNDFVGAQIGPEAMRKAVQAGYRPRRALLHVHTHGGYGRPAFSGTDRVSAQEFVPGFFNPISRMPHGLLVLSNDSAAGMIWVGAKSEPLPITEFIRVGANYSRRWMAS